MAQESTRPYWRYLIAGIAVSTALVLRLLLEPFFEENAPLLSFILAVMFSAWYGGLGPGLCATLLSMLTSAFFFIEPIYSLGIRTSADRLRVMLFTVIGIMISVLCESVRRSTERAERDALLARESEEQFRTLADTIPQLVWMAHADGHIFWYNRRWHDYTGTTLEQMAGWGWQSVHDPEVLPRVLERWRGAIATGDPFEMEFPLRRANGEWRTFLTRVQALRDGQGRVVRWFGTNTDVDQLKRVEASLRETQARLQLMLAAGSIGTWNWDIPNNRVVADENLARMFSLESDEAAGGNALEIFLRAIHEEDVARVREAIDHAIETGQGYEAEYRLRAPDGGARWVQARGRVEYDAAGRAVGLPGALVDITERKRAEEALAKSEQNYRNLVDTMNEGLGVQDLNGSITFMNRRACEMLGYELHELIGQPVTLLFDQENQQILRDQMALRRQGTRQNYDIDWLCKDGRKISTIIAPNPMFDEEGAFVGSVAVFTDITERKRAEEALRSTTAQLRSLSGRLQSAREEESARISREIHDELGQALTSIILELSWLEEQLFERGQAPDLIAKIRDTLQVAGQMVHTVRRIASELRPGLLDDFGLTAAIEWQAQEFQKRTGTPCELRLDPACANLPRQVSITVFRILQESLTNIARHAQATRVEIELRRDARMLTLRVTDDGRGVPAEALSNPRSLGLLGMRERALLLGGEVQISSGGQPGEGTTVNVAIPVPDATATEAAEHDT